VNDAGEKPLGDDFRARHQQAPDQVKALGFTPRKAKPQKLDPLKAKKQKQRTFDSFTDKRAKGSQQTSVGYELLDQDRRMTRVAAAAHIRSKLDGP
jgi:hypothetical protein